MDNTFSMIDFFEDADEKECPRSTTSIFQEEDDDD